VNFGTGFVKTLCPLKIQVQVLAPDGSVSNESYRYLNRLSLHAGNHHGVRETVGQSAADFASIAGSSSGSTLFVFDPAVRNAASLYET
jgi:hypothetical protein